MPTIFDLAGLTGSTRRTIARSGQRSAVSLQRDYAVGAADLWSAWTEPDRLGRWLGEVRGRPSVGTAVELAMSPSEVATVTVLSCQVPHRLVVMWQWDGEPDSFVDLRIDEVDSGRCRLHLEHVALDDQTALDYGRGWDEFLLRAELMVADIDVTEVPWSDVEPLTTSAWTSVSPRDDLRWPVIATSGEATAKVLRAARRFHRPQPEVWAAITDPDAISRWFGETTGELTPGGDFTVVFDGGGASGTVTTCTPMSSFTVRWTWDHDGVDTDVEVSLESDGDGTIVRIQQSGVVGPAVGYAAGWAAYLGALDASLAGVARSEDLWQAEWAMASAMVHNDHG